MTITINDYDYIDYNEPRLLLEWLLYQLELVKINKTGNITKFASPDMKKEKTIFRASLRELKNWTGPKVCY